MKRNGKRILTALCGLILLGALVTGCTKKAPSAGAAKKPVELLFAIWNKDQLPGMQAMADRFTEENPGITVKVEVTPWGEYWTKLEAGAVGNTMPDIFWMHANEIYKYARSGKLLPVDDGMIDPAMFPANILDIFTIDGRLYGVPKDFDTIGLFYNKRLFDEAGLAYPDADWDWDKLLETALLLTDEEKGVWGFGAPVKDQKGFDNFIYQNGGMVLSEDKKRSGFAMEETKEAIRFYFDMINKHKVSPSLEYFAENGDSNTFASGKAAMMLRGSWEITKYASNEHIRGDFDVAELPKGKRRAGIYNGLIYAGAVSTKHPEEVKRFLSYLGTEEAQILQGTSGAAIPAYKGTQKYWVEQFANYNVQALVNMMNYPVTYPTSPSRPKWAELCIATMKKIGTGEVDAAEGCDFIAREMDALLAEDK